MSFDESQIRFERFTAESAYHAAYQFWSLRGVLAERWGHGPIFGGTSEAPEQVVLVPPTNESNDDQRLQAIYGLRASGMHAEGEKWTAEVSELLDPWMADVYEVLQPKRVVRNQVRIFALYPVSNPVQASRRLRGYFYRNDHLAEVLPRNVTAQQRERFHSAIDFIVPFDEAGSGISVVVGAVGPIHQGQFFSRPDPERDRQWWLGIHYVSTLANPDGITNAQKELTRMVGLASEDYQHVFSGVLRHALGD